MRRTALNSLPPAKPTKSKPETTEQEAGNANTNTTNSGTVTVS